MRHGAGTQAYGEGRGQDRGKKPAKQVAARAAAAAGASSAGCPGIGWSCSCRRTRPLISISRRWPRWGAAVANNGDLLAAPPNFDQPHDRNAWVHYAMGDYPALRCRSTADKQVTLSTPGWRKQHTFCDHHFGRGPTPPPGTCSPSGGQTPTFSNPPSVGRAPELEHPVDLHIGRPRRPGVLGSLPDRRVSDQAGQGAELNGPRQHAQRPLPRLHSSTMAKAGTLPQVCYVGVPAGFDEHPPANPSTTPAT